MVPKEWEVCELQEVCGEKIVYGIVQAGKHVEDGVPYIKSSDVGAEIAVEGLAKTSTEIHQKYKRSTVEPGDIIFSLRGNTGDTSLVPSDLPEANLTQGTARIAVNDKAHNRYLRYQLGSRSVRARVYAVAKGSTFTEISLADLRRVPVQIPPLPEQHKIADILSTWDEAIEKTEALLTNARTQKRALMQQLLTGKRRFPEFEGQPWKEVRLGDVITSVKRPLEWSDDALYRLISVRRRSGGLFHREDLYGRDIKTKNLKNAQAGDFLISKMQVVHGAMGLVTEEFDGMQISGSYISVISKVKSRLSIRFFDWLSRMPKMYHQAYLCSYGVHIEKMTFSFDLFLKETIVIPPTVEEQEKIVSALEAAQAEERELEDAITKLRTEKKALMQQLLTGKRRVNVEDGYGI